MRHILSTALVALIVGSLAGVTVSTLAQSEPEAEQVVSPAATVANADKVDGRHAVKYTSKRGPRAGKLVATNSMGFLPSNIVKPYWGNIRNKPAGFTDGVDNVGVSGVTLTWARQVVDVASGSTERATAVCPSGYRVSGGGFLVGDVAVRVTESGPLSLVNWSVKAKNFDDATQPLTAWAMCLSTTPAGALTS